MKGKDLFTISTVTTDAQGWASLEVRLPRTARVIEIVASTKGFDPLTFTLTGTPVDADDLAGPRVAGVAGAGLSIPSVETASPNAIVTIFGENFAPEGTDVTVSEADLVEGRLPVRLAGVCAQVGSRLGRMFHVSPGQLSVQVPVQRVGRDSIVEVFANCSTSTEIRSNMRHIRIEATSPEFFFFVANPDGQNPIAAVNETRGTLVGMPGLIPGSDSEPAFPGDIVTIFMTGLGLTEPAFETGELPASAARTLATVQLTVNGVAAEGILRGSHAGQRRPLPGDVRHAAQPTRRQASGTLAGRRLCDTTGRISYGAVSFLVQGFAR